MNRLARLKKRRKLTTTTTMTMLTRRASVDR